MKNLATMAGFNLMMLSYSGLLFWATLYIQVLQQCHVSGAGTNLKVGGHPSGAKCRKKFVVPLHYIWLHEYN